jgi:hypothetical protein
MVLRISFVSMNIALDIVTNIAWQSQPACAGNLREEGLRRKQLRDNVMDTELVNRRDSSSPSVYLELVTKKNIRS